MNKIFFRLTLALLVLMLSSCRHKDFCYFHPHGEIYVEVTYDDDNDPDDAELLRTEIRATRLMAYHAGTGDVLLTSDINREVTELPLSSDTYHFLAYNAGTQSITFNDREVFFAHGVTTRTCDILEPLYDASAITSDVDLGNGEDVVIPAEPLWGVGSEAVECNLGDVVRMTAIPLHCRYSYEMRNVENLNTVSRMSSFITGMARGAILNNAVLHDTPVTVAVPAKVGDNGTSIVGSFFCFGDNAAVDVPHRMGLFVELNDGAKYRLLEGDHFDVTTQVTGAPNRRRVHIIIDGVVIPQDAPEGTTGGFDVTVNPWVPGEDLDLEVNFGNNNDE